MLFHGKPLPECQWTIRHLLRRPQAFKLEPLVAYNAVKVGEKQLAELGNQLREMVGADPPSSVIECTTFVKSRKDEWALSDAEVVKVRLSSQLVRFGRPWTPTGV